MIQPNVSPLPEENLYVLLDNYEIIWDNARIIVPWGFKFSASIPFFGWLITHTPFHPKVLAPSLVHDWMYASHMVPRKTADKNYLGMLKKNGVNKIKARLMYRSVRLGGKSHWKQNSKAIKQLYSLVKNDKDFDRFHFPVNLLKLKEA